MTTVPGPADRPDILLVTVDAYRRDCLGLYEPGYPHTPALDAALSGFVRFDRAYASAPWTLPSMTSVLTGVAAHRHGRFGHDGPPLDAATFGELLGDDYETIGFVNNGNLMPTSLLNRGFGTWRFLKDHDETFAAAREAWTAPRTRARCLFVHTNLPHDFFEARAQRYYDQYVGDGDWFQLGARVVSWNGVSPAQADAARRAYHASVAHLDGQLSALLALVDLQRTVVVVTADHGEGLDPEHERVHHGGRLHDDLVRVPLLMHLPAATGPHDGLAAAAAGAVSTTDIVPTVLGAVGIAAPEPIDGIDLRGGPRARVLQLAEQRYLYVRGTRRVNVNYRGKNMSAAQRARNRVLRATALARFTQRAFVADDHKLTITLAAPGRGMLSPVARRAVARLLGPDAMLVRAGGAYAAIRLVDLSADPGERTNVLGTDPEALRPWAGRIGGASMRLGDDVVAVGEVLAGRVVRPAR